MADAIVVGGGVMGLAAARDLRHRGYTVTLLERAQPGRAASWASAGIIGATLRAESDPNYHLRRVSRELWPAFAEAVHGESDMDPEYREMGCIQLASDAQEMAVLRLAARQQPDAAHQHAHGVARQDTDTSAHQQTDAPARQQSEAAAHQRTDAPARQHAGGGDKLELLDAQQLSQLEPALSRDVLGGLLMPGGNVDNRRLCKALEIAARRAGVQIEPGVEVTSITTAGGKVQGVEVSATAAQMPRAARSGGRAHAERRRSADLVVLAAGAWSANIQNARPVPPISPQRGQILALDQSSVGVGHVLLTAGDPYFVPRCDGRLVIGATREEAGWDPSLTAGGVAWLLTRAIQVVPAVADCPIAEMWTGFRPASADGLPLIGQGEFDGLYFLTGHGPSGIAPLPGSVALLMALIHAEPAPVPPEAFDPLRFAHHQING